MEQRKVFKFGEFMKYYMNPNNLLRDKKGIETIYYLKINKKWVEKKQFLRNYILVNDIKVYVKYYIRNDLKEFLFTIPEEINGKLYDNHYHFIRKIFISKRKSRMNVEMPNSVLFHKTIQYPDKGKRIGDDCFFIKNEFIDDISKIKCINDKNKTMADVFPETGKDFPIIKEIIQRPFYNTSNKNTKSKTKSPAIIIPTEILGSQETKENTEQTKSVSKENTTIGGVRRTRKFRGHRRKTMRILKNKFRKSIRKFPRLI